MEACLGTFGAKYSDTLRGMETVAVTYAGYRGEEERLVQVTEIRLGVLGAKRPDAQKSVMSLVATYWI